MWGLLLPRLSSVSVAEKKSVLIADSLVLFSFSKWILQTGHWAAEQSVNTYDRGSNTHL